MGGERRQALTMNLVVTDTGPLLHLHQIGALDLLPHLGTVHLTPTVWSELRRHAPAFLTRALPAPLQTVPLFGAGAASSRAMGERTGSSCW